MPYRRTKRYARRRQHRQELADADMRPAVWEPPALRRRITIEDFDGPAPVTRVIELRRTRRIDSYRVVVDGEALAQRMGWSRFLDRLRRSMPRLLSPRALGD